MLLDLSTEKAHDVVIVRWLPLEYNWCSRPGMLSYCIHLWLPPWTPPFAPHTPAPWCHPSPEWYAQTPSCSTKFSCHFLDIDSVVGAGGRSDHTLKSLVSSSKGSRHTPQRQPWYHDRGRCCKPSPSRSERSNAPSAGGHQEAHLREVLERLGPFTGQRCRPVWCRMKESYRKHEVQWRVSEITGHSGWL